MKNTTKNKKNQEQISLLNHNELNTQNEENLVKFREEVQEIINLYAFDNLRLDILFLTYKYLSKNEDLAKISDTISKVIATDKIINNPNLISNIINGFTQGCISKGTDLKKIGDAISKIVQDNPDSAIDIINGFTQSCISEGKDLKKIGNVISWVIKDNPNLKYNDVISGFTQGCILRKKNLTDISNIISKIVKDNSDSALDIINSFTQSCISKGENLADISGVISGIIKKNSKLACNIINHFTQCCILTGKNLTEISKETIPTIIQTDKIKDNPDSALGIINGFIQGCLIQESNNKKINIKDIAEDFFNLLNIINKNNFGEKEKEIKDKLKLTFSLIVSQHLINTLTNSNKQLSEEDKKQTETQLFECYKELFHVEDKQEFQNISLKELSDLQEEYLKKRFKKKGVNGGLECETFLKMACNLMPKSEGNKELTVEDLEKQRNIFKDLKFIDLHNREDIKSKEQLFNAIGLEQKDFGTDKKGSNFSIVHCTYLNHAFVMIIDKTKEWDDAIKSETESIYLIDSSRDIETRKIIFYSSLEDKRYIFNSTPTLNKYCYQANGTCWLNAMSAVGFLLEKQQECIAEQKREQQEQVEQTEQHEQQPRKPYGLSIDELLKGFDKKRDEESGKIIESTPPKKELSSFEQGICDYSTEHFYTLTNLLYRERLVIKNILIKKIKQNKADQRKLSTASSRLEKSKEEQNKANKKDISLTSFILGTLNSKLNSKKFIIQDIYLRESLERFTQNTEKLKELCAKFDIKGIKLSEPEQKEDSSNKKRKYNIFSSCIPDNTEGQNPKNITKQNETCCTIL